MIVDDDLPFRTTLVLAFLDRWFDMAGAGSFEEAVAAQIEPPELALVDSRLAGKSGLDALKSVPAE